MPFFRYEKNKFFDLAKIFFEKYKKFVLIICLFSAFGMIVGIVNVVKLADTLELKNLTDVAFYGVIGEDFTFFTFAFYRLLFILIPVCLMHFCFHKYFAFLIVLLCVTRAYFFAFNFTLLLCNLNILGFLYLFIVCFPAYFCYLILIMFCFTVSLCHCINYSYIIRDKCRISNTKKIFLPVISLYICVILYEGFNLFIIFNKYMFAL